MKNIYVPTILLLLGAGCSPISQQAEQNLARPIDCRTAPGDIRVLQSEKANVLQQIASGVTAIQPAAAVIGVASGTEGAKLEVASGDYNRMIDEKIAAIKKACGL